MTTIGERFVTNVSNGMFVTPLSSAAGYCFGYVYGKLADLPAGLVAKAMAIYMFAKTCLIMAINIATGSIQTRAILMIGLEVGSSIYFIHEMRKRGLMGDKLMILAIVVSALTIIGLLQPAITGKEKKKEIPAPN